MSATRQPLPSDPPPVVPPFGQPDAVRILAVDDQPGNLDLIDTLLANGDCQLVRAQSADEALLALLDQDFAVIILDIMMPGMNGIELASLIKQRRRSRDIPILFLTAHMMDESDVLRGYTTGAVDYLTKPIRPEILRSKVAVFVELYRKGRALADANASLRHEMAEREQLSQALVEANHDLERRVQERTQALQRADRRKDEFLASLAHELRNPLAPIRAAAEVLRMDGLGQAESEHARAVIVRQIAYMTRLIDDLLDVSRITVDKLVLQLDRIQLASIVAAAVETSRPLMAERTHHLHVSLPVVPVTLHADPARLAQVLSNLLTNAARYTPPGGDIRLTAEISPTDVVIRVRDNGIGIAAELLPRIFDLFMQGSQLPGRTAGGLGIGLTLARRLVEMHGGRLEVQSEGPGTGSEFTVHLPPSLGESIDGEQMSEPPLARLPARRILVVDDNEDAAQMLAAMLGTWGQETELAYDGLSALSVARTFQPEIVLLDIGLPNLDGYETARRLREESRGRVLTIIAVTGWGQDSDLARSRVAGFDHHMVKPVSPRALRTLIAAAR